MLIEGADYFVRLVDFPVCSCGGLVTPNEDGTFTILLNSRLSHQQNVDSLNHEVTHIKNNDFCGNKELEDIEAAHINQ